MALAIRAGRFISTAELHGAACGLVASRLRTSADGETSTADLLEALIELLGSDALTDAGSVDAFIDASIAALLAEDMSFQPLLPDDDAPVAERVQAIAEWCGAFAAGYGAGVGEAGLTQASGQEEELLRDFIAISGAVVDGEDDDSTAQSLFELEQYAKVGALLLFGAPMAEDDEN